jgi:nicotinate phosphoribosyltransferase
MSASRYAFLGGVHGTSNMAASRIFGIPASGTHAHAFVTSFSASDKLPRRHLPGAPDIDFVDLAHKCRAELGFDRTNVSELLAFAAYALAFPDGFLALVDTYDTLESGVPNFLAVALALHRLGRRALGIRLDSGDLAYFSKAARALFASNAARFGAECAYFERFTIVASNDINESTLRSLAEQGHAIDVFGIGTNLVTCQKQPALGCVFKLVEVDAKARIKLSDDVGKANMPGRKVAHRLFGADQQPLVDLLQLETEKALVAGERLLCVHPFESHKRAYVTPSRIERLHHVYWLGSRATASDADLADAAATTRIDALLLGDGGIGDDVFDGAARVRETPTSKPLPTTAAGSVKRWLPPLAHLRGRALVGVKELRSDHVRQLNPTPYKVSVSQSLHDFIKQLWLDEAPIHELK